MPSVSAIRGRTQRRPTTVTQGGAQAHVQKFLRERTRLKGFKHAVRLRVVSSWGQSKYGIAQQRLPLLGRELVLSRNAKLLLVTRDVLCASVYSSTMSTSSNLLGEEPRVTCHRTRSFLRCSCHVVFRWRAVFLLGFVYASARAFSSHAPCYLQTTTHAPQAVALLNTPNVHESGKLGPFLENISVRHVQRANRAPAPQRPEIFHLDVEEKGSFRCQLPPGRADEREVVPRP